MSRSLCEKSGKATLEAAIDKWGNKFKALFKSWEDNWTGVATFFDYSEEIKRIIYTTNPVESVHKQFRRITKSKVAFPNEGSLLKLLYLVTMEIGKKWTIPVRGWNKKRTADKFWSRFLKRGYCFLINVQNRR